MATLQIPPQKSQHVPSVRSGLGGERLCMSATWRDPEKCVRSGTLSQLFRCGKWRCAVGVESRVNQEDRPRSEVPSRPQRAERLNMDIAKPVDENRRDRRERDRHRTDTEVFERIDDRCLVGIGAVRHDGANVSVTFRRDNGVA